ncbi:ABC transporter permease [Actinacidiphila glaucinigra]|uniref:ABC transporter permease n=1 Tax=Actinacidiphila glaucinigra TaxID=235986 RepID=UPI00366DBCF7
MTAVAPAPRPPFLRGLPWSVVRLHRTALWLWIAFVAAGTGWLLRALWLSAGDERYDPACAPRCIDPEPFDAYIPLHLQGRVMAILPLAVAVFAGGALVGRELERGTAALAWVQSVTPTRWLATKLAVPALLLTGGTTGLTLLFRRVWSTGHPEDRPGWYENDIFLSTGPVLVAYVLLGLALGALAGLLMRRTLSGLGLAFFATLLVYVLLAMGRTHLWPATRWTGFEAARLPGDAERLEVGVITAAGESVQGPECNLDQPGEFDQCLADNGYTDVYAVGHPASHYWPLQLVETGIVLALAALACWAAFALLRRRTA